MKTDFLSVEALHFEVNLIIVRLAIVIIKNLTFLLSYIIRPSGYFAFDVHSCCRPFINKRSIASTRTVR